jgi:4-alpha-glucanotransferase
MVDDVCDHRRCMTCMTDDAELDRLCALWGVETAYADIWGHVHPARTTTKRAVLDAMDALSPRTAPVQTLSFPSCAQVLGQDAPAEVTATFSAAGAPLSLRFRLVLESGAVIEGDAVLRSADQDSEGRWRCRIALATLPPPGYHDLELRSAGDGDCVARSRLIVVPSHCFQGTGRAARERIFGPAVQIYALRSRRNWGIGDFTDLGALVEIAATQGADLVGINPLHALFPDRPDDASPYSPSSRMMLNTLYLDVEAVDDFSDCEPARSQFLSAAFQRRVAAARAHPLVDYRSVTALKFEVLEVLYRHFREHQLDCETPRGRAFRDFQRRGGDDLLHHTLFEALAESSRAQPVSGAPGSLPDPPAAASADCSEFLEAHRERVEFFQYLQWQAHRQLAEVAARARQAGMAIGLYRDLAVGADAAGSETWHRASLFARGMHVGAPPDDFNLKGQDWGLPPWIPRRIAEHRYDPWVAVLRANMQCAGALRIDHVMGLMRLYWIPAGSDPRDGAYVRYSFDAMLGVLALESLRAGCVVVGEDLGTVPDAVRGAMARLGILSCRVLYFEHTGDGGFAPPQSYPREALCTFSTHDLPTLAGFLAEADLRTRDALNLFPDSEMRARQFALRRDDRRRLHASLRDAGLLGVEAANADSDALRFDQALCNAVHAYLARTPSRLMTFQLEDVFGVIDQANMPSTTGERYPNWRRKLPVGLEDWRSDGRFAAVCAAIRAQGRGKAGADPAASPAA